MNRKQRRAARSDTGGSGAQPIGPAAMQLLTRGMQEHQAGLLTQAAASYRAAIALEPAGADIYNNLGMVLKALGDHDEAIVQYRRAVKLRPGLFNAHANLGAALQAAGRPNEAATAYRRALALDPDVVEIQFGLGCVLSELGRLPAAVACFERAIALKPDHADAYANLGTALRRLGRPEDAVIAYRQAIAAKADHAGALADLHAVLQELRTRDEADAGWERTLRLNWEHALAETAARWERIAAARPDDAQAYLKLGAIRRDQDRMEDALACFERVAALHPDLADVHCNVGLLLQHLGRMDEACEHYRRALAIDPSHGLARLANCMAQLPIILASESEITARRDAYARELAALCKDAAASPPLRRRLGDSLGALQPFFLAYQGCNDRDLQSQYGALFHAIMAERFPPAPPVAPPRLDEPIRVGIISGFFGNHSNWKIPIKGWLSQLDRRRFELYGYYLDQHWDDATRMADRLCRRFVSGPLALATWRETILADRPHVLVYPEIGMSPIAPLLAAQRLAPVQCNSWGHPDTSGLPTLDYYLSSALMEPADADAHYTEKLVRLPNLSIYYEPMDVEPARPERSELGLRPEATVYWCSQSLQKYLPQFDEIFPRIARDAGDCQFVFLETLLGRHVLSLFRQRLDRAFSAFGLDPARYCVFLPYLSPERFRGAMACCDVFLDSIGWSGCNSTLESLSQDLPIVTLRGGLMRGRHSAAILEMMDVAETVTDRVEDYVAIAVRMARDPAWRAAMRRKIGANKHRIWRDGACITALEDFLERAVRRPMPSGAGAGRGS